MKTIRFILCLSVIWVCSASAGDPLSPDEQQKFLQDMTHQLNDVKNFQVDFVQQRHLSILLEPLVSEGVCYFEKSDKMRWEISDPYASILIYNSQQVAKFEIDNGKLIKLNFGAVDIMRKVLQQIISWMQGDFGEADGLYSVQIYRGDRFNIQLIPTSEAMRANLKVIELSVDPHTFRMNRVTIRESADNFIQIDFNNKQENCVFPAGIFHTEKPALLH